MGGRTVLLAAAVSVTMVPALAKARVPDRSSQLTALAQSTNSTSGLRFEASRGGRKLIGLGVSGSWGDRGSSKRNDRPLAPPGGLLHAGLLVPRIVNRR